MSILKVDKLTDVAGQELIVKDKGNVIQTVVVKSDTTASLNTTSFTEASSDYRVSITPINAANRIFITMSTAGTMNGANNTIFMARIQNFTSGSAAHITSTGASGNRYRVDYVARPNNGQDGNDVYHMILFGYDEPASTAQQTYGFTYRRETGGDGSIFLVKVKMAMLLIVQELQLF
ncbi:hypothetical protein [uncultured phage MedDCM-OCT-S04-C26]|nr:hypothetical protein [uncultured phage MedDCM-OCT-S04-C26]